MARWARDRRVFFVEEPVPDPALARPRLDVQLAAPRVHVVVPRLAPGTHGAAAEPVLRELLEELFASERVAAPVMWFYTPMALGPVARLPAAVTVYDCMDELTGFAGAPAGLGERERELFARADLVFTGGDSLYEAKRDQHPAVYAFPSSVDAEHFRTARRARVDPPDQSCIPRPRVGFFGVIDERMDVPLLGELAARRRDLAFVLIGPVVKIDPALLPRGPNLHWLGPKSYDELPSYIAGWDVAMMPFARNAATRFISPTKTLEYLAAGKPVVSTSICDVVRPYGEAGLARIADTPSDFSASVDAAVAEPPEPALLDAWLSRTSWDETFARMRALVEGVARTRATAPGPGEAGRCSTI